jgi:mono/diheme cytochrome c family protein
LDADIKQWDIAVLPDGTNLPPGSGTPAKGAKIFAEKCSACHGDNAKGGVTPFYPSLVGGQPLTNGIDTVKTIANYYAYATTIFDYTRRAMPYNMPRSLTDDEVYSLTAYILSLNKLIGDNDVMDAKTLAAGEDAEPRQLHHAVSGPAVGLLSRRDAILAL